MRTGHQTKDTQHALGATPRLLHRAGTHIRCRSMCYTHSAQHTRTPAGHPQHPAATQPHTTQPPPPALVPPTQDSKCEGASTSKGCLCVCLHTQGATNRAMETPGCLCVCVCTHRAINRAMETAAPRVCLCTWRQAQLSGAVHTPAGTQGGGAQARPRHGSICARPGPREPNAPGSQPDGVGSRGQRRGARGSEGHRPPQGRARHRHRDARCGAPPVPASRPAKSIKSRIKDLQKASFFSFLLGILTTGFKKSPCRPESSSHR